MQTDIADSSNQERFDQRERSRMKSDEAPSTSKRDTLPNQRKVEVGKKHQTYSGPLVPSGSERVHTSGRFIFSFAIQLLYKQQLLINVL